MKNEYLDRFGKRIRENDSALVSVDNEILRAVITAEGKHFSEIRYGREPLFEEAPDDSLYNIRKRRISNAKIVLMNKNYTALKKREL